MPSNVAPKPAAATRRRFLSAATAAAATLAAPQVSRAQTAVWRFQSAWSSKDIFHEFAADYASKIEEMTGGRVKFDVLAAGSVVPAFQMQDAVHAGILDGGHGVCDTWYRKHKAASLFGSPPSFGWDAHGMLAWFYAGGGEALYRELVNDILKLNLTGLLSFPMPAQPLGWFKKEIRGVDDLKGISYRSEGLAADLFKALGASVTILPSGEIVPIMDRGQLDAAGMNNPSSDLRLGLPEVAKFYMMGSHHRSAGAFEIVFNKAKHDALPAEIKSILRHAALAASTAQLGMAYARYPKDLDEIRKRGVNVVRTGDTLLRAQLAAWDKVIAEHSKEPFFAKVIASQKAWVRRIQPYLAANNFDSAAMTAAYRHFFG
jgi:TRAP-type mannitol/chloroaromatic compound transport system substrate-binding protein